jgi:hypothetical protein
LYAYQLVQYAAEMLHAVILCVLLTRGGVADLFVRGSETGEDD